jgi:hypothetical protein
MGSCADHADPMPHPHGERIYGPGTAFNEKFIKSDVLIMGENKPANEARYIHNAPTAKASGPFMAATTRKITGTTSATRPPT